VVWGARVEGQVGVGPREENRSAAFERLLAAELLRSYRLATVILGNPVEAEDATHDAAVRAWRSFGSIRDPSRFGPWFQRILVNVCRRRLAGRQPSVFDAEMPASDASEHIAEQEALDRAMARLTPDHRAVIALRFLEDLTEAQTAERIGIPVGTVKSRLHYALSALRAAYAADARLAEEPIR